MSANTDSDDYWTQQYSAPETSSGPSLDIETIEGVEPLDAQFGVAEPKTVPDVLYEPLCCFYNMVSTGHKNDA